MNQPRRRTAGEKGATAASSPKRRCGQGAQRRSRKRRSPGRGEKRQAGRERRRPTAQERRAASRAAATTASPQGKGGVRPKGATSSNVTTRRRSSTSRQPEAPASGASDSGARGERAERAEQAGRERCPPKSAPRRRATEGSGNRLRRKGGLPGGCGGAAGGKRGGLRSGAGYQRRDSRGGALIVVARQSCPRLLAPLPLPSALPIPIKAVCFARRRRLPLSGHRARRCRQPHAVGKASS